MSARERSGQRDLLYNDWHRRDSFMRYMTQVEAHRCAAIDIDFCEWCTKCYAPLALVETQQSRTFDKPYTITRRLAVMADIPAFVVSYWPTDDGLDIAGMRVQQVAPRLAASEDLAPREWALRLYELRVDHESTKCTSEHALREAS